MAKKMAADKSLADRLIAEVDAIAKLYREQFAVNDYIKALQGLERCVELKMKICGFDGKQAISIIPQNDPSIPLSDLPTELLQSIVNHIKTQKMIQQQF